MPDPLPLSGEEPPLLEAVPTPVGRANYFLRHWRGDLPLATAYWVNTFGVNLLGALAAFIVKESAGHFQLPLSAAPFAVVIIWSAVSGILVWQTVGVSRAAARYAKASKSMLIPLLAWGAVGVMSFNGLVTVVRVGVPQLIDGWNVMRGDPQWPDPVITMLPTAREIEFSGAIKLHAAAQLEQALSTHPAVTVLHLETVGGREGEARAMAAVVRRYGLVTYVDEYCLSAGTIVFLAGKERVLRKAARLGFHSARGPGLASAEANRLQEQVLLEAGASAPFVGKVINTLPSAMWYPTQSELLDEGIVTRITDGEGFSLGTRELARYDERGLRAELAKIAKFKSLFRREPEQYGQAVISAVDSIRRGVALKMSLRPLNTLLATTVQKAQTCPSDAALDAYVDLSLQVLRRNMYRAPQDALYFLRHGGANTPEGRSAGEYLPDYPIDAADLFIVAMIDSPRKSATPTGEGDIVARAKELIDKLAKTSDEHPPFYKLPKDRLGQIKACETWERFLTKVRALPADDRHLLGQYFFDVVRGVH